ncbi:MAG: WD40/YVTN/BNR-like repeat-containing protein [Stellaceae bacterium]
MNERRHFESSNSRLMSCARAGLGALALLALLAGCEGRAQKQAVAEKIGLTAVGHPLPLYENYYATAVADKDHAWAVGTYGTILKISDNGSRVTLQPSGTQLALLSASASGPQDVVLGGENGLILHTTDGGAHWNKSKVPDTATDDVEAIARGADPKQIWAVGPEGMIIHSADGGDNWEDLSLHKDVVLNSVDFLDDKNGWIVGEFGTIMKTADGGHTWQDANKVSGLPKYVEDVTDDEAYHRGIPQLDEGDLYFIQTAWESPTVGYVVGTGGFVLTTHDGGQSWQARRGDTLNTLFGVGLPKGHPAVLVGILGTLVHQTDSGWVRDREISNSVYSWLRSLRFAPDGLFGIITGSNGTILITHDGGANWAPVAEALIANATPGIKHG